MKTRILLLSIATLLLLLVNGCDRFKHNFEPDIVAPQAAFTQDVELGFAPLTVQFTDQSQPGTNPITAWQWDFNNDQVIDSSEQNPEHTFNAPGNYLVALTVSDGERTDSAEHNISVYAPGPPIAAFNADPEAGTAPLTVQFTDQSLQGDNPILTWEWDFDGDSSYDSSEQNPEHTFIDAGNYPVTLTVSDGIVSASHTDTIIVNSVSFKKILVEMGTGIWCNGCPYAETALHDLKENPDYADAFYYIEYHIMDALEVPGNSSIINYYGIGSLPTSVFQGEITVNGGNNNTYSIYENTLLSLMEQEAHATLTNFAYEVALQELNCSILIEIDATISQTDLVIKASLVEIESSVPNYDGDNCRQVPLVNYQMDLDAANLSVPVEFTLQLPASPPDDLVVMIWIQTAEDNYNPDTCVVHNVIEHNIDLRR